MIFPLPVILGLSVDLKDQHSELIIHEILRLSVGMCPVVWLMMSLVAMWVARMLIIIVIMQEEGCGFTELHLLLFWVRSLALAFCLWVAIFYYILWKQMLFSNKQTTWSGSTEFQFFVFVWTPTRFLWAVKRFTAILVFLCIVK